MREASQQSNRVTNHTALGLPHPWNFPSIVKTNEKISREISCLPKILMQARTSDRSVNGRGQGDEDEGEGSVCRRESTTTTTSTSFPPGLNHENNDFC